MSKTGLWVVAGVAVMTLLFLVYLAATFEAPAGSTTVAIPAPVQAPAPAIETPRPALPSTPVQSTPDAATVSSNAPALVAPTPVEVPVVAAPEIAAANLPVLNDSDSFVLDGLRAMQNGVAVVQLLADEQMVRKFVVFVENVSRGTFPQTELPYRPLGKEMSVSNIDDDLFVMDGSSHARFNQVVNAFVALDTSQAVLLYRSLSPLFQQAYAEIGFRDVNFDDTLRAALNRVLSAPNVEGPYQLIKPSVMYLYADSRIENLPAVNKQLIRLGPENAAKLQDQLRQFVLEL